MTLPNMHWIHEYYNMFFEFLQLQIGYEQACLYQLPLQVLVSQV